MFQTEYTDDWRRRGVASPRGVARRVCGACPQPRLLDPGQAARARRALRRVLSCPADRGGSATASAWRSRAGGRGVRGDGGRAPESSPLPWCWQRSARPVTPRSPSRPCSTSPARAAGWPSRGGDGPDGDSLVVWRNHLGSTRGSACEPCRPTEPWDPPRRSHSGKPPTNPGSPPAQAGPRSSPGPGPTSRQQPRYGIAVRRISRAGALRPVQQLIGPCESADYPDVAIDSEGDSVVVWQCSNFPGKQPRARHRREDRGRRRGRRAAATARNRRSRRASVRLRSGPQVAMDADGDAVVVWREASGRIDARTISATGAPGLLLDLTPPRSFTGPGILDRRRPSGRDHARRRGDRGLASLLRGRPGPRGHDLDSARPARRPRLDGLPAGFANLPTSASTREATPPSSGRCTATRCASDAHADGRRRARRPSLPLSPSSADAVRHA